MITGRAIWRTVSPLLLIVAAGALAYHNSLQTPFVYDDEKFIVQNEHLRTLWPPWKATLGTARPVVYLTWALNYAAGGLDPVGYHVVNLAIHLMAALVLYGLVRRSLLTHRLQARYGEVATTLAFASALLWVVHPLTTESVTFIYQRAESLMALFYLLTLYAVLRGAAARRSSRWYTAAIVFCALGMASKAIMVTAPLMVLLYDRLFLAGSFRQVWRQRRGLYLGLMSTWALLVWLLVAASSEYDNSAGLGYKSVSAWGYLWTQPGVLLYYVRLAIWPHPLVFDYCGWPVARTAQAIVPPLVIIGGLIALTVRAIQRGRPVGFLGAWFFGILAPTSSVIPIADLIVEHRIYLPLAACVVLGVIAVFEGVRRLRSRSRGFPRAFLLFVAALAVALGLGTVGRNADYGSPLTLWQDVLAKRPDNPRAHYAIGTILGDAGNLDEALRYFARAYQLNPRYIESHYNTAVALSRQQRYPEAFARFEELIRLQPRDALIRYSYGLSLANAGRLDAAVTQFRTALDINPDYANAHYNLGIALLMQGKREEATAALSQALLLQEHDPQARDGILQALAKAGMIDDVIAQIKRVAAQRGMPQ